MDETKFFDYEYDDFSGEIIQKWKSSGKTKSIGLDRNGDRADDKIIHYSSSGKMIYKTFDNNFNGEFEETDVYNKKGDLIEKYKDLNEDGFTDVRIEFRKDTIFELKDINLDGFIDSHEIVKRTYNNSL